MKICGLKITHDAAVAGIDGNQLVFCVEIEKLRNNPRYTKMKDRSDISLILKKFNFEPDCFVIDGWKHGKALDLSVSSYHEFDSYTSNLICPDYFYDGLRIDDELIHYKSYTHITGHIVGTYCCSPFSINKEPAYVITWDRGQNPRVHFVDPDAGPTGKIQFIGILHEMYSIIYGIMGYYFGPYKKPDTNDVPINEVGDKKLFGGYDIPGKLMSYIALGKTNKSLLQKLFSLYYHATDKPHKNPLGYNQDAKIEHRFMRLVVDEVCSNYSHMKDAEVLSTIHDWLQVMLVDNAIAIIPKNSNLCFTGGSALNIKWNSALRRSGHFKDIFIPPFPNDSGSAIGVACCEMISNGNWHLNWHVYCGMPIQIGNIEKFNEWEKHIDFDVTKLAKFLAKNPSVPVVVLNGRAEVGPRALGNRSILCSAALLENKTMLNELKRREEFRPVAPICIEADAPDWFSPGTPDPYMLFDHRVRIEVDQIIPAVIHLDRTARLQTVNSCENAFIHTLLSEYKAITGVPILCNTSANLNGSGFFPDVASAMEWGKIPYIWSEGIMYVKTGYEVIE